MNELENLLKYLKNKKEEYIRMYMRDCKRQYTHRIDELDQIISKVETMLKNSI